MRRQTPAPPRGSWLAIESLGPRDDGRQDVATRTDRKMAAQPAVLGTKGQTVVQQRRRPWPEECEGALAGSSRSEADEVVRGGALGWLTGETFGPGTAAGRLYGSTLEPFPSVKRAPSCPSIMRARHILTPSTASSSASRSTTTLHGFLSQSTAQLWSRQCDI